MSRHSAELEDEFAGLRTSWQLNPAEHDTAFLNVVRHGAQLLDAVGTNKNARERTDLQATIKDRLVGEANKLMTLTTSGARQNDGSAMAFRWRLRESQFLTVASRLATNGDEKLALRYRADLAEQDFAVRFTYLDVGPVSRAAYVASELEHRMNKDVMNRYGFPPLFQRGMAGTEVQSLESVRRAPSTVLALKTQDFSRLTKGPTASGAVTDPRDVFTKAYKKGWSHKNRKALFGDEGREGDVDLVWGDVLGQPRLMLRTYYNEARLFVDDVTFTVVPTRQDSRIARDGTLPADNYDILRVPQMPPEREMNRAQRVAIELDKSAGLSLT